MKEKTQHNKIMLYEGVLNDTIPSNIISSISTHRTYLRNNPGIPNIYDCPFLVKISNDYFDNITYKLKEMGGIDNVKSTTLKGALAELINKCKKIESQFKSQLEDLCYCIITDIFAIPEGAIDVDLSLVENIDYERYAVPVDSIEKDFDLDNVNTVAHINKEVYKRRLLNVLIMGAAMDLSSNIDMYANEISNINPELPELYEKIILLNNYLLFESDIEITDNNKQQMGVVELKLGNNDERPIIKSQGIIFPVLLCETIRGFFELFISHGLPKNRKEAQIIINKSDFIKSEPWSMRFGPSLWKLLSKSFNDIDSVELPYLLKRISSLDINKFNFLMKEVFAKTKKGKEIMSLLSFKSKEDMDYDKFVDKIEKHKNNKGIITDDFIHLDEL